MLLYERKHKNRLIALLTVFSIMVSFFVPYIEMAPGVAITQSEVQTLLSGLPNMTVEGNAEVTISTDNMEYGNTVNGGSASRVNIWLQVDYGFNIQEAGVSKAQPSFYFELNNYDVEWLEDWTNRTASDNSAGWVEWRNQYIGNNKYAPATYDVYRDENGKIYVIVTLNERYIDYIETQGSNQVKGNVKFSADVSRDDSQDGDKTIFDGAADLKVSFDDIDPTVNKEGGLTYQNDPTTGKPIIRWTITLNDFYELKNFALSDTHLNAMIPGTLRAVDENGQQIGISANGNNFVFDQETTTSKKITITYESVATDAELNDTSNGHKGFATNTVNLNYKDGVTSTGQVDLNADFKAHITKTGKPSYEVDGEKGYIYWTVTVSRNYKGSLDGYVVTDSIEGVDTSAMELVSVTGATVSGSAPWTISGHTPGENVVITYKTPVTKNQSSVVKNTASVTPPDGSTPDNSDPKQVIYNDTDLYTLNKTGSFDENTEKITWTITIDATKQNSLETLNGYVIEDDAFSRTDIENMTVTAWNDYGTIVSGVPITNIASLTDGKYVVNSTPAYDKIEIKYTVPLTTEEIADRADLKSGETLTAKNTVKVSSDGDNPDVETLEGNTSVPSGIIGITASKNWEGYFSDNDRTYPVTITLQKRLGYNGEWTNVEAKTIASASDDQKVEWNSLPKKENGESVFYRVVETVADDANYSVSYSNNNGVNYNSTIYITNTWKNMAVSVNKHWNGDSGHENDRPDEVKFELWQTYDWSEDWTNTGKYAILNTDTNDITYYNSDGTTTGVKAWSDLPRTEDGKVVYYKIVEEDVAGYTSNGGNVRQNSTGTITITNTADYFKLTANKVWDDGNYTEDRKEIIFDLYESTDNQTWTLKDSKTLSSMANENAVWDWLPSKDANGNNMYYKVEERDVPENYTASYSNNGGIQGNPGSDQYITITNTWQMMNVSVQKNWVNISDSERPGSVELELWRRIEGKAWEKVPDLGTVTVTASDYWKKDNAWKELPKTIDVDGVTAKIYYAAREVGTSTDYISTFDINGINNTGISTVTNKPAKLNVTANKKWTYSTATLPNSITVHLEQSTDLGASWTTVADSEKTMNSDNNWGTTLEWNDLPVQDANGQEILYRVVETEVEGFNTTYSPAQISANSGNIEITNTQKATYQKFAIKPKLFTDEKVGWIDSATTGVKMKVEAFTNKIDFITPEDLVLSEDGNSYIFKWYLDLSTTDSKVYDLLPDDSTLIIDAQHPVSLWNGGNQVDVKASIESWYSYFKINGNIVEVSKDISACSFYIQVPKDVVDNEIATTGKYIQTNKIKADGENEYLEADLVVSNEGETGTINKKNTNDKSSTVANSKGMAIGDTRAYYSLDVNPDALYLSSSDTVTVTDTFRILKYLDSSGEIHTGYDLLNAALENVAVYEIDNSTGKRKLLTSGYSYVISQVNDSLIRETDLTTAYSPTGSAVTHGGGTIFEFYGGWTEYKKGSVLVVKLTGNTGDPVNISQSDKVSVEASSDTYVNGSVVLTVTFLEDVTTTAVNIGVNNATSITVLKYVETETIEATQHIVTFTIPDGKHIAIDYEYLLTNLDGSPIGRGLSLWLENDSVVYTSGGEESSKADEEQFSVSEVTGNISTGGVSKIMKVDVGNYSIKNLEAEFILAKFDEDTGDWIYATEFPFATSVDKEGNTITSTTDHTISYEGAVAESSLGGIIPSTAQAERIKLKGAFNVSFEDNALYKLIELKAPDNYMETGFVEGVSTFEDMLDFTTYFTYIYSDTDVSDEVKASANIPANKQITMLNYLASIEIPNAKPISIGAEKNWEQDPASAVNNPSVTLELWKSYQQISNDVPSASIDMNLGAIKVGNASEYFTEEIKNAENMTTSYGVGNADGTFTLTRQGDSDYVWRADEIWENLPNGENGKPVYYYVKEVAYTIGGVTYKLNAEGRYVSDEGNAYIDGEGNEAEYRPTYSNNALNDDGVVNVTNTRRFVIKKIWMRSDGSIMTNPPDTPIEIKLEGYLESTKSWQELILGSNNIVSAENGWEVEIAQRYLTAYSKFRVTEINPPYNYTISTIYELDGTVGTVKLVNKSKSPTQTSLDVTKIWGDDTTHDPITVVLYQANSGIEESALAEMSKGTMPENAEEINLKKVEIEGVQAEVILSNKNSWHYIWNNLPYADELEKRLYYYAVETEVPEGYTVTYEKVNSGDQTETITNSIPGALSIDKNWIDTEKNPIVVGKGSIELQVYTATVTSTTASAPIVETTPASTPSQGDNTETETSTIKIMPVGDSITWGYSYALNGGSVGGYRKYLYHELTKLGYNVDMVGSRVGWDTTDSDQGAMMTHQRSDNTGEFITYDGRHESISGWTIDQIRKDLINKNKAVEKYKPDVVLLMAGTNDVLHNYSGSIIPTSTLYTLYDGLVDDIYSQNDSKDMKVFLLTAIPTTDVSNAETAISNLNEAARQVAKERTEAGYFCKVLDVNSDVYTSDKVATYLDGDGIHPTDDGYEAIGTYLAEQLDSYLKTGEAPPESGGEEEEEEDKLVVEEINDPTDLEANIIMGTLKPVGDPITIEPDESGNWSTVLKDLPAHVEGDPTTLYVYYIVEKNGDSYDVKYVGNGQLLTEKGTSEISLTNTKAFEPIDITVNKVWPEELPEGVTIPTQITVELYSSTVASDDESDWTLEESTTITNLNWSYTFTDLHGGKFWYVKEIADGWSATYDGNGLTGEDGTITITNTADTGNLSLKKEWYKDNTGGNSSVELKVYRVAYDDNGNPIYEYQPRLNSTSAAFSLSAMRNAFAVANSKETEIDLSDVQLSLGSGAQVLAVERTITVTEYDFTDSRYWIDVYDLLGECTITGVTVSSSKPTWSGSMDGSIAINPSNYPYNWGNHTEVQYLSDEEVAVTMEVNSDDNYIFINPWFGGLTSVVITYELAAEPFELGSAPSSLVAGDTGTITATGASSTINWSSSDNTIATVDANGVITAKSVGEVTITGQDGDDTSRTVSANVTVTPFQINGGDTSVVIVEGGSKVNLSANNSNGSVTWSSDNEAVSVDANTGELTLNSFTDAEVIITADHGNGVTDTIIVNVQPSEVQLGIDKTVLHVGGTATLTPTPDNGISYTVDNEGVVSITGNTVTATGLGTVNITAERNGESASVTVVVADLIVTPNEGTYNINSDITLSLENVVDGIVNVESSKPTSVEVVSTSDSTIVLKAIDEGDAVITIKDGAGAEVTATIKVEIQQATVIEPDVDNLDFLWNKTITLGESNNWYGSLADLPLTDGNGHVYTYYVVEELPTGANYYPIYYSDNDGFTLENGELTSITVENKADEVESEDVLLPESGGSGITVYYFAGGMIIMLAAAGYIMFKRRKYDNE